MADGVLLHDVGKVYIASDILSKPGSGNRLEYKVLQTHTEYRYDIVR